VGDEKAKNSNLPVSTFPLLPLSPTPLLPFSLSPCPLVSLSPTPFPLSSSQAIFGHTKIRVAFFGQLNLKRNFEAGL